jgi:HD-GYP domain-containing protein (c-di-GMP phosphodiesterase class II)
MAPEQALAILQDGAGTQWDPVCVEAFLSAGKSAAICVPGV